MTSMVTGAERSEPESLGSKVKAVCWLLVALSTAFLSLRVFCKFKTHRGLWWDDHILIVAWVRTVALSNPLRSAPLPHQRASIFSKRI